MTSADLSAEIVQHVRALTRDGGWLDQLQDLAHERSTQPRQEGRQSRVSGSPMPFINSEVSGALDYLAGATRELEAQLRRATRLTLRHPRALTLKGTKASMLALCTLAEVADSRAGGDAWLRETLHHVAAWESTVRQLADVGLEDRWTRPPREPGQPAPVCSLCGCHSLRVARAQGRVRCVNPACTDARTGRQPEWDVALAAQEG